MRQLCFMQGEDFLNIPAGARNGVENGLELLLDVEAFESAASLLLSLEFDFWGCFYNPYQFNFAIYNLSGVRRYAYFPSSSKGFSVAFSGPLVRPVVRQQGWTCNSKTNKTILLKN